MAGLLNVGEMGAIALHVLVELAALRKENRDAKYTAQELAEKLHASVHTLQKVVRRLIQMGLIEGVRGAKGGLFLLVDPKDVTMLRIIEGVEGRVCANGCLFAKRVCPPGAGCVFGGVTGHLEKSLREYFAGTTIADLVEKE